MSKPKVKSDPVSGLYIVRPGFYVHGVAKEPFGPGTVVALDPDQHAAHAHQVEDAPEGSKEGEVVPYAVEPAETAAEAPAEDAE